MIQKFLISVFFIFIFSNGFSQSNLISRGELATEICDEIFGTTFNPNSHPAAHFATSYLDLQIQTNESPFIKILSFLEHGDGIPAFSRERTCFEANSIVSRVAVIKTVLEAWGLGASTSTASLPYPDYNDPNDEYYPWVVGAYNLGLLPSSGFLSPYNDATNVFLYNFLNDLDQTFSSSNWDYYDMDNYFIPLNITAYNMNLAQGMQQGVFSHYAKNSFNIPDIKLDLNFSHSYSNSMVEINPFFYPVKPLGRGWSHTYNSYIIREDDVQWGNATDDFYYIIWPDGTIHVFNEDDDEYVSKGVYDELDEIGSDIIRITKKDQTEYTYEKLDNNMPIYYLVKIEDRNDNEINIDYEQAEENDMYRVEEVESPSGKTLSFDYQNNTDLVDKVTDPIGRNLYFEYTGTSSNSFYSYPILISFEDAKFNVTDYQYDTNNPYDVYLLKKIELPEGNEIKADFDDNGKLQEYQFNNEDETYISVYSDYLNDYFTSTIETPQPGNNNFQQDFEFNEFGLITEYEDDNNDLSISYPNSGVNISLPDNTNMNGVDIEYDYDNDGNIIKIDKENGDLVDEFDWNSDNTLDYYTDHDGNATHYYYDNNGNTTEIKDALNNYSYFTYDSHGQMLTSTNQEGIQTVYTHETDGVVSTINMPENISHSFQYDGVNRLLQKDDNGLISSYLYDPNDNITSFTNTGGFVTTYNYDDNDNLTGVLNAHNNLTELEYDNEDRLIKETFGNIVQEYEYDDDGFLDSYYKTGGTYVDYEYDSHGRLEETSTISDIDYNSRNLIEEITTDEGQVHMEYDNLNRLEKFTSVHNLEIEYDYYDNGNINRIHYPNVGNIEFYVRYYYDEKNRMTKINSYKDGNFLEKVAEYTYRDDDLLNSVEYGNGIYGLFEYDNAGRKTGVTYTFLTGLNSGDTLFANQIELNNVGNITEEKRFYKQVNGLSDYSASSLSYQYDQHNHIQQAGTLNPSVNLGGNTEQSGSLSFDFDMEDHLTEIDNNIPQSCYPFEFGYDGFGNLVNEFDASNGSPNNTMQFTYDVLGDNMIYEQVDGANQGTYYVYGTTGLEVSIADLNSNPTLRYRIGDLRGSIVTSVHNVNQAFYPFRKFDDFGNSLGVGFSNTGCNFFNDFSYIGKYGVRETRSGLYYMKARYYDPKVGRFITDDPVWSTNVYPYADNNPISKIDPKGKTPLDVITYGIEGSAIIAGGFSLGISANYIGTGEHASHCPIITGGLGVGVGVDFSIGGKFGGYSHIGSGSFLPEYLNTNGQDNWSVSAETPIASVGGTLEFDKTENGVLEGYFLTGAYGAGGASLKKNLSATIFNWNQFDRAFNTNFCSSHFAKKIFLSPF